MLPVAVIALPWLALGALSGALVSLVLPWFVDALVALGVVLGPTAMVCRLGSSVAARATGAHEVTSAEQPGPWNILEGLAPSFGVDGVRLALSERDCVNVASFDGSGGAVVVLTSGAVSRLGRIEMEALLAHELAHVRAGHLAPRTLWAAALAYGAGRLSRRLGELALRGRADEELLADVWCLSVTRYPPGLERALQAVSPAGASPTGALALRRAEAHLWLDGGPGADSGVGARIAALGQL